MTVLLWQMGNAYHLYFPFSIGSTYVLQNIFGDTNIRFANARIYSLISSTNIIRDRPFPSTILVSGYMRVIITHLVMELRVCEGYRKETNKIITKYASAMKEMDFSCRKVLTMQMSLGSRVGTYILLPIHFWGCFQPGLGKTMNLVCVA